MSEATLVWEVGCEELPAWACYQLEGQVGTLVAEALAEARLVEGDVTPEVLVGPRRFTVTVDGVLDAQRAVREEKRGPAYDAAFRDGTPTKACEGFARSLGLTPDELDVREDEASGTKFVWGVRDLSASPLAEVWPGLAAQVLQKVSFAKPMRWGSSQHRFVRPVRWVLTLHGDTALEYDVWNVRSGTTSRTHRFLGDAREVTIDSAAAYERTLGEGYVVADQAERLKRIQDGLAGAADALGGTWGDPGGVLREVVHLVEYPTVITGRFDEKYLELPERVLVTAMQSHQRYLPVSRADGGLANAFLAVMNGDPMALDTILPGYERVIQGRLDDAVFSFERDKDRGLDDMASDASLAAVVFHARAGSLADRRTRIARVAEAVADDLGVDLDRVALAARLAKADQVSYVVQEFAELEGFAGSLYARDAGHPDDVVAAIDQQFLPKGQNSPLPDRGVPAVLALADKLELIATMFSIGEQPTGSKDPHALRRAAIGVARIVLEHDLPLDVDRALGAANVGLEQTGMALLDAAGLAEVREFVLDRVEKALTDAGVRIDAVRAARGAGLPLLQHLDGLARALDAAVRTGDAHFAAVLTALTRCAKILDKAGADAVAGFIDASLLEAPSERALYERLGAVRDEVAQSVHDRRFEDAVAAAAKLGPEVDAFFDRDKGVMVMADDAALRGNRLALVRAVVEALRPLGALSQLQV